jgi:hypothetical protein
MPVKMLKHIGKLREHDQKVYVVWMQLPDDKTKALVVAPHTLPDMVGDELRGMIESDECQSENDLAVFLNRKTMMSIPGGSILNWLHTNKKLIPVPVTAVVMIPHPSQPMALSDLLDMMDASPLETVQKPLIKADTLEEKRAIAQNLLGEAQLLREEAAKKEKTAHELMGEPIVQTVAEPVVQPKKRGRKPKTKLIEVATPELEVEA